MAARFDAADGKLEDLTILSSTSGELWTITGAEAVLALLPVGDYTLIFPAASIWLSEEALA